MPLHRMLQECEPACIHPLKEGFVAKVFLAMALVAGLALPAIAYQEPTEFAAEGTAIPTAAPAMSAPTPNGGDGKPPSGPSPGGGQPGAEAGKNATPAPGGAASPGAKADGQSIKRPTQPAEPPNKKEFDVKPDEQGMVQFQFRNQSWPDILKWLAENSRLSLDWQELPGDHLNIATQRKLTLDETRDLINRHLLARGFTMLELDSVIQVSKTAGINVSLVPKVPAQALEGLPPNRFVRTTFSLTTLIAKDAASEFKPLISSNGTLHALEATNRLEAMDSAGNLAEVYRIIHEEESEEANDGLAREFELEFVRAPEAREQLLSFLGIESKSGKAGRGTSPEEMMMQQQQMQMQMQMQQMQMQQQQQGGGKPGGTRGPAEIFIVANVRRNSIIAHAPPDKMAIIVAFLKRIDVPNEISASLQRIESRMKVYRLTSLDPKQLVTSMIAMDALEPTTRLEVDEKNRAIIAYASLGDQLVIQQTIDRLDGSARDFEVIQLRRLRAEEVAGTIKFLMGKEEPKDENRGRNRYYYDPFGFNQPAEKPTTDLFRVGANSQDNQILLWANEIEIKEVNKLLVKLGEIPPEGSLRSRIRTIDASRSPETREYLKRLQESWAKISPDPLKIPDESEFSKGDASPGAVNEKSSSLDDLDTESNAASNKEKASGEGAIPSSGEEKRDSDSKKRDSKDSSKDVTSTRPEDVSEEAVPSGDSADPIRGKLSSAFQEDPPKSQDSPRESTAVSTSSPTAGVNKSASPALDKRGIEIKFDEKGNLILMGDDLDALDRLEQMMLSDAPPRKNYEVFYIKHARPSWIELNLKDYFKDEDGPKKNDNSAFAWIFGFDPPEKENKVEPQLNRKRKLKFISDLDTRSLIVMGADDQQLKNIRSLIKLWDVPEKTNRQKLRFTKLVRIEHSRAESIVDAIKDAYRDLLSTNDKAFTKGGAEGSKESKHEDSSESVSAGGGMSFSFTGRLSLGIDRVTNSVIVSAEGEDLLKLVIDMIKELDVAAQPTGAVQMIEVGGTNSEAMERALKALMGRKEDRGAPNPSGDGQVTPNETPTPPNQQFNSQGNNRGRNRRNG